MAVPADVLDRASLEAAVPAIEARFGPVYGLVNAAGGNHPSATTTADLSFFDLPEDALRTVLDLNLVGTILPCQVFGRGMAERGDGRDPELFLDELLPAADPRAGLLYRQGGGQQPDPVAGGAHGQELCAGHPRQRRGARAFSSATRTATC